MQVDTVGTTVTEIQQDVSDEEEAAEAQKQKDQFKLKTRRQSKGIAYFNRLRPTQQITVGTLEEWFVERQHLKRRKLDTNQTLDPSANDEIEIRHDKLNKSLLHEEWLDDFNEDQKKKLLEAKKNSKKRKRSERSRSPTPVRSASISGKSAKSKKSSVSERDDSEEDRLETEKMKVEIFQLMVKKAEPVTLLQISYTTKYAKKYCEEVIAEFLKEGKIKQKEISKNNMVFYIPFENTLPRKEQVDLIQLKVEDVIDVEMKEHRLDKEIAEVEKQIKNLKLTPTTEEVQTEIGKLKEQIEGIIKEIDEIKERPDFMGEDQIKETKKAHEKMEKLKEIYLRRKQGCMDMLEQLADQFNVTQDKFIEMVGIDKDDMAQDDEVMKMLDLFEEKEVSDEEEEPKPKSKKQIKEAITEEDDEEIEEDEEQPGSKDSDDKDKKVVEDQNSEEQINEQPKFSQEDF